MSEGIPDWLRWARKVQAISQAGLTFAENEFDRKRYEELQSLAVEMLEKHTGVEPGRIFDWFRAQPGYATPKVDVRGACFRDNKVLLVREKADGLWCLPGGWADVGDLPSEAAEREVEEEGGYSCKARKVIGVFDANRAQSPHSFYHAFKVIFLCDLTAGEGEHDHEILETGFFSESEIPPLSTNRTDARHLAECFAHLRDPARATAYD